MCNNMVLGLNVMLHQLGTICYHVTNLLAEGMRK